jgi:uncharacterized SAM-binding protein YcdF (DUF218 family)
MSAAYHAIVVLGATVRSGQPSATLRARLEAAERAFVAGRAPRLIVTGQGEAEPMRRFLLARGVPAGAIELEPRARTTYENALYVAEMVPAGARLLLCTQPSHQRRACGLFSARGVVVEPLMAEEAFSLYRTARERIAYAHHRWRRWL